METVGDNNPESVTIVLSPYITAAIMLGWLGITALGTPVVPDV